MKWYRRFGKLAKYIVRLYLNRNLDLNSNNNDLSNSNDNGRMVQMTGIIMKTYKNLYEKICSMNNLANAWKNTRKGKTKKKYVVEFETNLRENLLQLRKELLEQTYRPEQLKTFILRDPKTRRISKSAFRDRIVHRALVMIIEPIFEKMFIYDSCANRIGKGNLFALRRLKYFITKISENGDCPKNKFNDRNFIFGYILKADIKHYFQEIDHEVLLKIIRRKISDERTIWLIKQILSNISVNFEWQTCFDKIKGMPLGNLTSQFFANVYLNELDYFVKHTLRAKYYIRYVDDFIIFHKSKIQLKIWKVYISNFLKSELKLELHIDKSKVIPLSRGVDFVGFRNFYQFKLLRRRNINKFKDKIKMFNTQEVSGEKFMESLNGWTAYAKWANSYNVMKLLSENLSISSRQDL
jgi:RNA-directed DNA polymerase